MCHPIRRLPSLVLLASAALLVFPSEAARAASRPAVRGTGGAVSSEHPEATAAGIEILRAGGNAVDSAVATALALAVVYPEAGNLGGGGFAVVKMGNEITTLDFREVAPAAATDDMYLGSDGEPIPEASLVGPLAAGVPGSPVGLWELHRKHGRLAWAVVVEPARRLAADGFIVDQRLHRLIEGERELFARFPETAAVWLPGGEPPAAGSLLALPDLATTLGAYAKDGPEAITGGPVAQAIETTSDRHGGILAAADLSAYRAVWREPVRFQAFGWEVASMALPSSGGIILGESTALLERLGWQAEPRFGAQRRHLLIEVLRQAFADRFLLGDPETTSAGPADLLSQQALSERYRRIPRDRAGSSAEIHPDAGTPGAEGGDTTHLSTVDGEGNLVALTTTLNGLFGCGLYVPEAGFFLNNEMDDFAAAPGRPNMFGLVQGEANKVRPGRRMLSSMSPTIAWRATAHGEEAIALGGRGGSRIPTNTLQVLLNAIADGDPLQTALDRPRIHHQWLPDVAEVEPDTLAPETRSVLEELGHRFEVTTGTAKIQAVGKLSDGRVEAGTDPRVDAAGAVVRPEP